MSTAELPAAVPCPRCGKLDPEGLARSKCRECGVSFTPEALKQVAIRQAELQAARKVELDLQAKLANPPSGTKQYKVLTQRDEFFKSKFNPESLQHLINLHAIDGWRVVSVTATDVGSFIGTFWAKGGGASRQELVVLLERVVP